MSVHHQMINRQSIPHASSYYPPNSGLLWSSSNLICPNSNHPIKQYPSSQPSRSEQLRIRIHENHLSYLSRDETPFKHDLRAKIEALITEYLSQIPHCHKFSFKEIGDCLSHSVKKADFDPQKAIIAFEQIERYSTNILNYPWRLEFQTIFAFSGFFHRVIECTLVDYQSIFEILGFVFDSSTNVYKLIEVPIDPDKVSKISLECLVAIVECKIMLKIQNLVKLKHPDISCEWNEIHSIRTDYICNTESAVKLISDLKNTGKLIDLDLPDYSVKRFPKLDLLSPVNDNRTFLDGAQANSLVNTILPPPINYLESNLDTIDFIDGSSSERIEKPPTPVPSTFYSSSLPANSQERSVDSLGNHLRNKLPLTLEPIRNSSNVKLASDFSSLRDPSSINSNQTNAYGGNFVDDKPKNCKYNNIDPVLLAEINQFENNRKNVFPSNGKPKNVFASSERNKLKVSIGDSKASERVGQVQIINCFPKNTKLEPIVLEQKVASAQESNWVLVNAKPANLPDQTKLSAKDVKLSANWPCKSCTYKNTSNREICDMCHRSRVQGPEATPLQSGGRECSRCTLINSKELKFCQACQTSLADSPTYIWYCESLIWYLLVCPDVSAIISDALSILNCWMFLLLMYKDLCDIVWHGW